MKLHRRRNDLELIPYERIEHDLVETSHSAPTWAVSYADLLMVLMSFFVIFYETKMETKDTNGLYKLAVNLGLKQSGTESAVGGVGTGAGTGTGTGNTQGESAGVVGDKDGVSRLPQSVVNLTELFSHRSDIKGDEITIYFQDELFGKGEYKLSDGAKADLKVLAETLTPEIEKLQLTVIGHADSKAVRYRNEFMKDNFDLSAQRAMSVLRDLMTHGLPAKSLFAQGIADNSIAKRTMTIRIQLKEKIQ